MQTLKIPFREANLLYMCFLTELPLEKSDGSLARNKGTYIGMMSAMATVKNKVFDAYGIESFIVGSRKPTSHI